MHVLHGVNALQTLISQQCAWHMSKCDSISAANVQHTFGRSLAKASSYACGLC